MRSVRLLTSLAVCGLFATPLCQRTCRAADSASRAEITGAVLDSAGKPVQGATVRIWTAGARVGVNPYCPSCYLDCGKTAKSDAGGAFTIKSLDPTSAFRVLFVAKGYEPQFANVDPQKHESVRITLNSRRATLNDPRKVVSGQFVDSHGKSVAGALVEPFGCKQDGMRWWGELRATDPLAVTDGQGRFEIVTGHTSEAFDLKVSATGLAPRNFLLVPTVKPDNRLVMTIGATVRGRVVDRGTPVPGVKVRMVQSDRNVETSIGPVDAGTDSHGEFLFNNVPPNRDYHIYGTMDSLRDRGCIAEQQVQVGADGSETKVADLAVLPANRVSGRIVLSDGKPLPPHARIRIGRENVPDSQISGVDANGGFTVHGVPPGLIELGVSLDGYRISQKNYSFEPRNAAFLEGLIRNDIDGLLVLLEPGKQNEFDPESLAQVDRAKFSSTAQRIKSHSLAGAVAFAGGYRTVEELEDLIVERPPGPSKPLPKIELSPPLPKPVSADANVPKRAIVGRVVDPGGNPVADADIWYPVGWNVEYGELVVHARSRTNGRFKLEFPIEWLPKNSTALDAGLTIWAYAPGYTVGTGNPGSQAVPDWVGFKGRRDKPLEIRLGSPADLDFTVQTPDGEPLAGAHVAPRPDIFPPALVAIVRATTNKHGRARISGINSNQLYEVVVESTQYGRQCFNIRGQYPEVSDGALRLAPVGRIEGRVVAAQRELFRDMFISIATNQDRGSERTGLADLHVDADGRFAVPEIAAGPITLQARIADERLPVRPRVVERNTVVVQPGRTTRIEIPLEMAVKVHGLVRSKETGKPMAGAAISVNSDHFSLWQRAWSDADGRYTATILPGDVNMQVIYIPSQDVRQSQESRFAHYNVPDGVTDFELPLIELAKLKNVAVGH